jgi:hypothetical protein
MEQRDVARREQSFSTHYHVTKYHVTFYHVTQYRVTP